MRNKEIPVIAFNPDSGIWEPVDEESEFSRTAAVFKNQLVDAERQSYLDFSNTGELHAYRNERRVAAIVERNQKKRKKRLPKELWFGIMIAMFFYILWFIMQR